MFVETNLNEFKKDNWKNLRNEILMKNLWRWEIIKKFVWKTHNFIDFVRIKVTLKSTCQRHKKKLSNGGVGDVFIHANLCYYELITWVLRLLSAPLSLKNIIIHDEPKMCWIIDVMPHDRKGAKIVWKRKSQKSTRMRHDINFIKRH